MNRDGTGEKRLWSHTITIFLIDLEKAKIALDAAIKEKSSNLGKANWEYDELIYQLNHPYMYFICDLADRPYSKLKQRAREILSGHFSVIAFDRRFREFQEYLFEGPEGPEIRPL